MPLRLRLTLVFALVSIVLLVAFATVLVLWQRAQQSRFDGALLDLQLVGWSRIERSELTNLRAQAEAIAASDTLADVLAQQGDETHATALQATDGKRLDVFDRHGRIVYTTAATLSPDLQMLDSVAVRIVLSGQATQGLVPLVGGSFSLVVAIPLRIGSEVVGGVALGAPSEHALEQLSQQLGSPVVLSNLRGQAVDGNGVSLYTELSPTLTLRRPTVIEVSRQGHEVMVISTPLRGQDMRLLGGLSTLRDISQYRSHDRLLMASLGACAILITAAALAALSFQLRYALAPLGRAVQVLVALSNGDTSVQLDSDRSDESGQIADGVARLRSEMINLDDLRDERLRERRRQERIIRDELRALAGTLDTQGRTQVLAELEAALASQQATDESGNRLAVLALVLRGLSQRVQGQQARMLDLLAELNEAMRTQEAFTLLQQELEIARRMQLSVLPQVFPKRSDVSLASMMLPAQVVGGDFYDYFLLDDRRLGIAIADVSGKGVPAAFFMAISRTLLKASAQFSSSPSQTLARVNNLLAAENEELMFVTLFYGVLELDTGCFSYANAGHNSPVWRNARGDADFLAAPAGMALAVQTDVQYGQGRVMLAPGDVLFLYTDGITEAQDTQHRLFGEAAMLATLEQIAGNAPVSEYPARMIAALREFAADAPQADDITCVTLCYHGCPQSGDATVSTARPAQQHFAGLGFASDIADAEIG